MSSRFNPGRRRFLEISAAAGGSLLIGFQLPGCTRAADVPIVTRDGMSPNAWIQIGRDGQILLKCASSEMGQGVMTAIPMLLAEELDADWSTVRVETAPVDSVFNNPYMDQQLTGGSTAIRAYWQPLREAGAVARELLVSAAAATWKISGNDCRTENGAVIKKATGERLSYGALTEKAASLPIPKSAFLKDLAEFRYLGKGMPRLDTPAKCDGSAQFGQDLRLPDMLTALVVRCPVHGGKLRRHDASRAKTVKGVREIFPIDSGIAVVANNFWSAKQARDRLIIEWDEGPNSRLSDADISDRFIAAVDRGETARQEGDVKKALSEATRDLEAIYEVPYLAHACMEPMNCTVSVTAAGAEVWVGTQAQTKTRNSVAMVTGLPPEKVKVHTMYLGGGFGRRGEQDFVVEAAQIAKQMKQPVKLIWTREDDLQHDFYRPKTYNRLRAGFDSKNNLIVWQHRIAGPSIRARNAPPNAKKRIDGTSIEGAANIPYAVPNIEVTYAMENAGLPVGYWRSVGSSQNAYVTECFLDEVARAAGKDPYEFRLALLKDHPRHRGVLEMAATNAEWGVPLPKGHYRGIAVAESFGSWVAQVAEVSIVGGKVRVHRVVCAIDCGMTVNPDTIVAQMESGIVYGLTAALKGEINVDRGRVRQSNFHDYPLLRMDEMPAIEVHIVPSTEHPGGVGEPGTPPIAPAVANAIFAATGKPVRRLPIRLTS